MITGHKFRLYGSAAGHEGAGIDPGMCGWLGTCNRPPHEHATTRAHRGIPPEIRQKAAADYAAGASAQQVARRLGISPGGVRYSVVGSGGTMRPRSETRTRS